MASLMAYCRAGYEADAAQEITDRASALGCYGYPRFEPNQGYLLYELFNDEDAQKLGETLRVSDTIFPRQLFVVTDVIDNLDRADRITPLLESLTNWRADCKSGMLYVDHADTEDGKELARFCRKFVVPLRQALRNKGLLAKKEYAQGRAIHVFFESFERCFIGYSKAHTRSPYPQGICRLRFPSAAPSRSTLKLEEAIVTMLDPAQQRRVLRSGGPAVDLGACPGGWTYQLVQRGMHVEAVDNGNIDEQLMASGLVQHFVADGFTYRPQSGRVDLLVCDMIEKPDRVARLMGDWLVKDWCRHAIFNLKLPMKKRHDTVKAAMVSLCGRLQQHSSTFTVRVRHLYHNRDEVTVCVIREDSAV